MLHNSKIIKIVSLSLLTVCLNATTIKEEIKALGFKKEARRKIIKVIKSIHNSSKDANLDLSNIKNPSKINDLLEILSDHLSNYRHLISSLDLSGNDLERVPGNIISFLDIEYLYMNHNEFSKYPQTYSCVFSKLKHLDLRSNKGLKDKTILVKKHQKKLKVACDYEVKIKWDTTEDPWA